MTMKITSNDFRVWRKRNSLSQAQAGELFGVGCRTISNWERLGFPKARNQPAVDMAIEYVSGIRELK